MVVFFILVSVIICCNNSVENQLHNQNKSLQFEVDSLAGTLDILRVRYDSLNEKLQDTVYVKPVDSLIIKDSVIVTYDKQSFPNDIIEKYLNLFFETDNIDDTTNLRYNFSIFDGPRLSYVLDSNYQVEDSAIGWRLDWYMVRRQKAKVKSKNPVRAKGKDGE